eukprot:TRINITY_DN963_c0_g1_i1.p1 TRINITY_DN963_c0_g1~~TRINITY_DN963_c0_g1_i1.p1  ORF type:complete len:287 (-),score=-21.33 TRINITY_DN963_c0_g1_i1:338-1198(-)
MYLLRSTRAQYSNDSLFQDNTDQQLCHHLKPPYFSFLQLVIGLDSIGNEAMKALGKALKETSTLITLDLGTFSLSVYRGKHPLDQRKKQHLLYRSKSNWSCPRERLHSHQARPQYVLLYQHIYIIEGNNIGSEGAKAIGAVLKKNCALSILNLGINLNPYYLQYLIVLATKGQRLLELGQRETILQPYQISVFPFHLLTIELNNIAYEGAKAIGASLRKNRTLTTLSLRIFQLALFCSLQRRITLGMKEQRRLEVRWRKILLSLSYIFVPSLPILVVIDSGKLYWR